MTQPANRWRALCLLILVASWTALGQELPSTGRLHTPFTAGAGLDTGGNGIKVGEGRLHPTFDFETRYDSAAGYFPPPGSTNPTVVSDKLSGEALLHIRPGLTLDMPGSAVSLNLLGYADYVHYTGLFTPGSTNTSHLEGLADLNVLVHENAPIEVDLADHFERSDRTHTPALGAGVLSLFNEAKLQVPLRPGGGALEVTPLVGWGVELFKPLGALVPVGCDDPSCDPALVDRFNYSNLRTALEARWRFLPKTAVVVDSQFNLRHYLQGPTPEALLFSARAGLAGLITPKIAVTALVGWGKDFSAPATGALLAQLEATYAMSHTASFKAGYVRTLEPVANFRLYRNDRAYLEAQALLGGRLSLHGLTSYDYLSFLGVRRDTLYQLDVGPQYQFQRWLIGGVGYLLGVRSSNQPGAGINYSRHEGYVRVTVTY
ncbi:MAG: hypothetical protein ACXU86_11120 [Archangium sp.]